MPNRHKYVLLIEDNPDDADLTIRAFSRHRFTNDMLHVTNGRQALNFLFGRDDYSSRGNAPLPSVVLLDLKLPQVHGLEVLRAIRAAERTRNLPVVVLTSSNDRRDIIECYESGANSYVRKSIDYNEFSNAIRQLVNYWLTLNVLPVANQI